MKIDWRTATAAELGRGIGDGQIDPVDLSESFLEAIADHEYADRIYARTTPDRARAEAVAAHDRAKQGLRRGLLDGVPISWKDLFDTTGIATEAGSALLKGRTPLRDATVLESATRAGLVCLGKTHMSELAFSGLGVNPITATPPNVNDPACAPGGSSSGAAASVAFGLAPAGIGSDTGGSVRLPAAWNDLVGLKTTSGRLSLEGVVPLAARLDTVGPLCRSVEDAALLLAAMENKTAPDLTGASLQGTHLKVLRTTAFDDIRDAPAKAFDESVRKLEAAGAKVLDFELPELPMTMQLTGTLYSGEAYGTWRDVIEGAPEKMFPEILARFRSGAECSGPDFVAAWLTVDRVRATYLDVTAGADAVLVPTSPLLPPVVERLFSDPDYYKTENLLALRNTRIGNLMGVCALTLPTGTPSCGLSLMATPFQEERLLRLGAAAEAALA